jgi:hypothetical protein
MHDLQVLREMLYDRKKGNQLLYRKPVWQIKR